MAFGKTRIVWRDKVFIKSIRDSMQQRLVAEAERLKEKIKDNIGEMFPPESAPGEFPHYRSGELSEGIDVISDILRMTIISRAEHSLALEEGTINMAARPFLRRTLEEERHTVEGDLTKPGLRFVTG